MFPLWHVPEVLFFWPPFQESQTDTSNAGILFKCKLSICYVLIFFIWVFSDISLLLFYGFYKCRFSAWLSCLTVWFYWLLFLLHLANKWMNESAKSAKQGDCETSLLFYILLVWSMMLLVWWQEGHWSVEKVSGGGWHGCLGWSADLHMAKLMPLPLTVFISVKSRFSFLFGIGLPGCPWQRAIKQVLLLLLSLFCLCICTML